MQVHVTSLHVSQSDQPAVHFPCLYHYHNFLTCHCFATCHFYDNAAAEPVTMSGWHDQVSGYSGARLGNHRCTGIPRNASGPSLLWERQLYFCSVTKMCPSTPRTPSQTTTQGGTFPPSESQEQLHQWQRVERKRIFHLTSSGYSVTIRSRLPQKDEKKKNLSTLNHQHHLSIDKTEINCPVRMA